MAKDKPQPQTGPEIEEYSTTATPKASAGSVPVFCAHDAIVPLKDLRPNPKNPNQHPPEQIKLLASIIRATGWRAPITVSKRSGLVTKGHGRLMAAQLDDLTDAPVDYQDYASEAEELADLTADNRIAELATTDNKMLAEVFADIDTGEIPFMLSGYTEDDYGNIVTALSEALHTKEPSSDPDAEIPAPAAPVTQYGDLWILGRHRVLCGDCTRPEDRALLLDGNKPEILLTDPPYCSGGSKESQKSTGSIGTERKNGKAPKIEGDKRKAAERVASEEQSRNRMMTLGDNSFSLLDEELRNTEPQSPTDDPVRRAAEANRAMQQQARQFYAAPPRNAEVEELREQVASLQQQLDIERQQPDPMEVAEEQYRLAQRYLGGGTGVSREADGAKSSGRFSVMRPVREGDVRASTLNPRIDSARERNIGFLTAAGLLPVDTAPTIRACVAQTQVVRVGSTIALRLLEPVRIDGEVIPRNTPLYGAVSVTTDRLRVTVTSIEYRGRIFQVQAEAYDLDGQPGINVPNSRERTALKEALASVGQTAGTSVNITHSAGQQVLAELARGGIQASSRYLSEKLREVRITLKANHQILLISKEN